MTQDAPKHKRAARLLAVQALYQSLETGQGGDDLTQEYLTHRAGSNADESMVPPDEELFHAILSGALGKSAEIDALITAQRPAKEGAEAKPFEPLLHSILTCGCYELMAHPEIDAPIIISDYVDVTHAFYGGKEPGTVNALLDAVRGSVRS